MTKRRVGSREYKAEITRAVNANKAARVALKRIIDEKPGAATMALLIAKAASALGENLEAIRELEIIGRSIYDETKEKPEVVEHSRQAGRDGAS